jgi:hypothetical protein
MGNLTVELISERKRASQSLCCFHPLEMTVSCLPQKGGFTGCLTSSRNWKSKGDLLGERYESRSYVAGG